MKVELLYFDDCPNWRITREELGSVLDDHGVDAAIDLIEVTTPEEAQQRSFHGSPSVRINEVDPFLTEDAPIALACRVYITSDCFAGRPTKAQLTAAVETALGSAD